MLRTLTIISNQIVLSFSVLIVIWSPKQSKIEESSLESMEKQMESSETWRTEALKSFAISKSGMQGGEAKRNLPWSILDDSHFSHFWSTSWSPIYACYISFRSSGSQKSNASNGAWFRVEMKELQPLQADHSKLKEEFFMAAKSPFCCENVVLLPRKFRSHFAQCNGISPEASHICNRHFEIFCFRYLMSKSPNSPCNPPIIGFLSL